MKLSFIGSHSVAGNVISFEFQSEHPLTWQPGQYMHYVLQHPDADDRGIERWFTNSAAPFEKKVTISTRIDSEHGSSFKRTLLALKPGDIIEADGPEGDFTIDDNSRSYIFVAGGIGITPFRSILVDAQSTGKSIHATLLYANRNQDIPFKNELDSIAAANDQIRIEYIVEPNRLDENIIKQYIDSSTDPLVYISGPEPMVKGFANGLEVLGVQKDTIKLDDFPGYEGI